MFKWQNQNFSMTFHLSYIIYTWLHHLSVCDTTWNFPIYYIFSYLLQLLIHFNVFLALESLINRVYGFPFSMSTWSDTECVYGYPLISESSISVWNVVPWIIFAQYSCPHSDPISLSVCPHYGAHASKYVVCLPMTCPVTLEALVARWISSWTASVSSLSATVAMSSLNC